MVPACRDTVSTDGNIRAHTIGEHMANASSILTVDPSVSHLASANPFRPNSPPSSLPPSSMQLETMETRQTKSISSRLICCCRNDASSAHKELGHSFQSEFHKLRQLL